MIDQALRSLLAGVPVGLQLGATGTGGAILGLPLMVYVAGIPMQQAAAMSLIIVATSSLLGAWEYGRQGQVKAKAVLARCGQGPRQATTPTARPRKKREAPLWKTARTSDPAPFFLSLQFPRRAASEARPQDHATTSD